MLAPPKSAPTSVQRTYFGLILNLQDALLVLEGARCLILPCVRRRLNSEERQQICAGAVYVWNENECGMKRWTDGKIWLASKVKSPFLTYHELDESRNAKDNGLIKQIFSLTTKQNTKLHLIAYYSPLRRLDGYLVDQTPSNDPSLSMLSLHPEIYMEDIIESRTNYGTPRFYRSPYMTDHIPASPNLVPATTAEADLESNEVGKRYSKSPRQGFCVYNTRNSHTNATAFEMYLGNQHTVQPKQQSHYADFPNPGLPHEQLINGGSMTLTETSSHTSNVLNEHSIYGKLPRVALFSSSKDNPKCLEDTRLPAQDPNSFTAKSIPKPTVRLSINYNSDDRMTLQALDKQFVM